MPLHPQIRQLLDNMAKAGAPAFHSLPPAANRESFRTLVGQIPTSQARIAGSRDGSVPGPAGSIPVRVYTPSNSGPFAIVVFFHGGGFVFGDLDTHDGNCREICAGSGAVVVAVDYRLAPEHKFPAAADDCYAATRWIAAHAADFGGDGLRFAVAGDSAGGNLAAVTCLRVRDHGGPRLAAQLLIYPVTDHCDAGHASMRDNAEGYRLGRADLEYMYGHYLNGPQDRANPLFAPARAPSLVGLPPALVQTAEFDPLRDEGEAYGAALKAAGVDAEVRRYDGAIHGSYSFAAVLDSGRAMVDDSTAWLKRKLG